jgi:hypothetical protein
LPQPGAAIEPSGSTDSTWGWQDEKLRQGLKRYLKQISGKVLLPIITEPDPRVVEFEARR